MSAPAMDSANAVQEIKGVTLRFLTDFASKIPAGFTTAQVAAQIIGPKCRGAPLVDLLDTKHVGPAQHYVMHAWSGCFLSELVVPLMQHFIGDPHSDPAACATALSSTVLWIDCFSCALPYPQPPPQLPAPPRPARPYSSPSSPLATPTSCPPPLPARLALVDYALRQCRTALLLPGPKAVALVRTWCLYELARVLALKGPGRLHVPLFELSLDVMQGSLQTINLAKSRAHCPDERRQLLALIAEQYGSEEVSALQLPLVVKAESSIPPSSPSVPVTPPTPLGGPMLSPVGSSALLPFPRPPASRQSVPLAAAGRRLAAGLLEALVCEVRFLAGEGMQSGPRFLACIRKAAEALRLAGSEAAEDAAVAAVQEHRKAMGDSDPATLSALCNLARWRQAQGRVGEAEDLMRQVLSGRKTVLGVRHPDTAVAAGLLGTLLKEGGRLEEAAEVYKEAVSLSSSALGPDHLDTTAYLNGLAGVLQALGRLEEAEPLRKRSLEVTRRALGDHHPHTATHHTYLGLLYRSRGDAGSALPHLRAALTITWRVRGPLHADTSTALRSLVEALEADGRPQEAEEVLAQARQVAEPFPQSLQIGEPSFYPTNLTTVPTTPIAAPIGTTSPTQIPVAAGTLPTARCSVWSSGIEGQVQAWGTKIEQGPPLATAKEVGIDSQEATSSPHASPILPPLHTRRLAQQMGPRLDEAGQTAEQPSNQPRRRKTRKQQSPRPQKTLEAAAEEGVYGDASAKGQQKRRQWKGARSVEKEKDVQREEMRGQGQGQVQGGLPIRKCQNKPPLSPPPPEGRNVTEPVGEWEREVTAAQLQLQSGPISVGGRHGACSAPSDPPALQQTEGQTPMPPCNIDETCVNLDRKNRDDVTLQASADPEGAESPGTRMGGGSTAAAAADSAASDAGSALPQQSHLAAAMAGLAAAAAALPALQPFSLSLPPSPLSQSSLLTCQSELVSSSCAAPAPPVLNNGRITVPRPLSRNARIFYQRRKLRRGVQDDGGSSACGIGGDPPPCSDDAAAGASLAPGAAVWATSVGGWSFNSEPGLKPCGEEHATASSAVLRFSSTPPATAPATVPRPKTHTSEPSTPCPPRPSESLATCSSLDSSSYGIFQPPPSPPAPKPPPLSLPPSPSLLLQPPPSPELQPCWLVDPGACLTRRADGLLDLHADLLGSALSQLKLAKARYDVVRSGAESRAVLQLKLEYIRLAVQQALGNRGELLTTSQQVAKERTLALQKQEQHEEVQHPQQKKQQQQNLPRPLSGLPRRSGSTSTNPITATTRSGNGRGGILSQADRRSSSITGMGSSTCTSGVGGASGGADIGGEPSPALPRVPSAPLRVSSGNSNWRSGSASERAPGLALPVVMISPAGEGQRQPPPPLRTGAGGEIWAPSVMPNAATARQSHDIHEYDVQALLAEVDELRTLLLNTSGGLHQERVDRQALAAQLAELQRQLAAASSTSTSTISSTARTTELMNPPTAAPSLPAVTASPSVSVPVEATAAAVREMATSRPMSSRPRASSSALSPSTLAPGPFASDGVRPVGLQGARASLKNPLSMNQVTDATNPT